MCQAVVCVCRWIMLSFPGYRRKNCSSESAVSKETAANGTVFAMVPSDLEGREGLHGGVPALFCLKQEYVEILSCGEVFRRFVLSPVFSPPVQ